MSKISDILNSFNEHNYSEEINEGFAQTFDNINLEKGKQYNFKNDELFNFLGMQFRGDLNKALKVLQSDIENKKSENGIYFTEVPVEAKFKVTYDLKSKSLSIEVD